MLFRYVNFPGCTQNSLLSRSRPTSNKNIPQFQKVNELLKIERDQESGVPHQYTFFHKLVEEIDSNNFDYLKTVNFKQICVPCHQFKEERTHHCKYCNVCIPMFEFHSKNYQKCINRAIHPSFYLILAIQQMALSLYLILFFIAYSPLQEGWKIFWWAEVPYILWNDQKQDIFVSTGFVWALILFVQNTFEFLMHTHGICFNMTQYEMFHRYDCQYYFENIHKSSVTQGGSYFRYYKNKFHQGIFRNTWISHFLMFFQVLLLTIPHVINYLRPDN